MLKVVFLPQVECYPENPYWKLLQSNLEQKGVEFVSTEDKLYLQWRWLVRNRGQVDVIHLHHLRHHYSVNERYASAKLLRKFIAKLLLARGLGYRIVWTVHNLYPHEKLEPQRVGRLAHKAVAQLANAIIVHCEYAREALSREFYRRRNVFTIAHPNYIGVYPNSISRQEARVQLGLAPDQRVLLFLGAIRPYKGLERLVEAFRRIPGDELRLVIAGKPWYTMPPGELEAMAQSDQRIILEPRFIPDLDLQRYYKAADVVVLPYTGVLSSGATLLSMSFGCPVIAPAIGCLSEVITSETGSLYDPTDPQGVYKALLHTLSLDLETLGQNAYKRAAQLTWADVVSKTLQVYGAEQDIEKHMPSPVQDMMH